MLGDPAEVDQVDSTVAAEHDVSPVEVGMPDSRVAKEVEPPPDFRTGGDEFSRVFRRGIRTDDHVQVLRSEHVVVGEIPVGFAVGHFADVAGFGKAYREFPVFGYGLQKHFRPEALSVDPLHRVEGERRFREIVEQSRDRDRSGETGQFGGGVGLVVVREFGDDRIDVARIRDFDDGVGAVRMPDHHRVLAPTHHVGRLQVAQYLGVRPERGMLAVRLVLG